MTSASRRDGYTGGLWPLAIDRQGSSVDRAVLYALQGVAVAAAWLLSRPYNGVVHDSRIYLGRALANLDPTGVGRDPLFAFDGQTRFTLYTALIQPLVRAVGPSQASILLTLVGLLSWLAAAAWLAGRLVPARWIAPALICLAVLPATYGPLAVFSFGESFATPRCLAEAATLAAMAALLGGRPRLCWAFLAGAALLHPVMALAGCGVAFLVLAVEDPRWWALAFTGLVGAAAVTLARWPSVRTAFAAFDPAWLAIVRLRAPFLFESAWPLQSWAGVAVATAALFAGALLAQGRPRSLFWSTLTVAALGLALTFAGADLAASKLMVQLQFWRAHWLVQALAAMIVPYGLSQDAGRLGRDQRLALALIAAGWCLMETVALALACCVLAVAILVYRRRPRSRPLPYSVWLTTLVGAGALAGLAWLADLVATARIIEAALAAGADVKLSYLFDTGVLRLPVVCATLGLTARHSDGAARRPILATAIAAALLAPLALVGWDQRTPTRKMIDRGKGRAELAGLMGPRPGAVLWRGDDAAPLLWLGRPTWVNELQGAAGTFSRPLSLQWDGRTRALVASGLGDARDRSPWAQVAVERNASSRAEHDGIVRLCRRPDGPSVIVSPGDLTPLFNSGEALLWVTPQPDSRLDYHATPTFVSTGRYTIVRCAARLRP